MSPGYPVPGIQEAAVKHTIVAYGEALWDLLPTGPVLGGAPFNFAYRVNSLGNRGVIITRLGKDDNGKEAHSRMKTLGMETDFIQWDQVHPTGTVEITLGKNNEPDYFIVPGVAYDFIEPEEQLSTLVSKADCLCFGTLIQRTAVSRETLGSLIDVFQGTYILLDINLRKQCFTKETVTTSIEYADILKLNETEIIDVAGMYGIEHSSIPFSARALLKKTGLALIVVTLGEKGAYAVSRDGEGVYAPGYKIELVDPCGSGDAFTAAFLTSILKGEELSTALQRGNALGALVAAQKGATQPVDDRQIASFLDSRPQEMRAEGF